MVRSEHLKVRLDDIRSKAFLGIKEQLWDRLNDWTLFATPIRYNDSDPNNLYVITGIHIHVNKAYLDNCGEIISTSLNELSTDNYISILEELEKNTHTFPEDKE